MDMKKYGLEQLLPGEIEKRSFEIISEGLKGMEFDSLEEPVIKRCIHTSADFDYARNLVFTHDAVRKGIGALLKGALIVTDTNMGKAGVNRSALNKTGCEVMCFMADEKVAAEAAARGETRAAVSMEMAARIAEDSERPVIVAVGNAPTALIRLYELIGEGRFSPALVIGVPVGFVNVEMSKELILKTDIPVIAARGRKGGSNIAAAILNALLYLSIGRE